MPPAILSLARRMANRCSEEVGFSLLEALIAIAVSAALLGLVIDVVGGDTIQTRRFLSRSEAAVELAQGRRAFLRVAASLRGAGTSRNAGLLRIDGGRLLFGGGQSQEILWQWSNGEADLSYSSDGVIWRSSSDDLSRDSVRFVWRSRAAEQVWIAP